MPKIEIVEIFPYISDKVAIFYARGKDNNIYAWNPLTHEWEIFKQQTSKDE